jgi:hypothetical protein
MKTPNIEKKSLRAMMAIVAIGAVLLTPFYLLVNPAAPRKDGH